MVVSSADLMRWHTFSLPKSADRIPNDYNRSFLLIINLSNNFVSIKNTFYLNKRPSDRLRNTEKKQHPPKICDSCKKKKKKVAFWIICPLHIMFRLVCLPLTNPSRVMQVHLSSPQALVLKSAARTLPSKPAEAALKVFCSAPSAYFVLIHRPHLHFLIPFFFFLFFASTVFFSFCRLSY